MIILKYVLELTDLQSVDLPAGAQLLSVANQNGKLCLWVMVDEGRAKVSVHIEIIGTGNPIKEGNRSFLGTVLMHQFVWHVFVVAS